LVLVPATVARHSTFHVDRESRASNCSARFAENRRRGEPAEFEEGVNRLRERDLFQRGVEVRSPIWALGAKVIVELPDERMSAAMRPCVGRIACLTEESDSLVNGVRFR
jgi:hypothetical protein